LWLPEPTPGRDKLSPYPLVHIHSFTLLVSRMLARHMCESSSRTQIFWLGTRTEREWLFVPRIVEKQVLMHWVRAMLDGLIIVQ